MIASFRDRETEDCGVRQEQKSSSDLQRRASATRILNAALALENLEYLPGIGWRRCMGTAGDSTAFALMISIACVLSWRDGNAFDVEIVDYH